MKILGPVLIGVFLVHISYIPNGFSWLDRGDIFQNRAVLPLAQFYTAFFQPFGETGFYRPMVTLLHSINTAFFGKFAPGHHFIGVLLHVFATAVVFTLLKLLFSLRHHEALFAATIFGLHPASSLPVGSGAVRQEILLVIFCGLSLTFLIQKKVYGFVIFSILALLSKETAIILLLAAVVFKKRFRIALILALFIYISLRFYSLPEVWKYQPPPLTPLQKINLTINLIGRNLLFAVSPLIPSINDSVTLNSYSHPHFLIGLTSLFTSVAIFILKPKTRPLIFFTTLLLAPSLALIPVPRIGSPHYAYLTSIAFALLITKLVRHYPKTIYLASTWLFIASIATFQAGFRFKNDLTLFLPEVIRDQSYQEGNYYLGNYYFFNLKDYLSAQNYYLKALTRAPNRVGYLDGISLIINIAGTYTHAGKLDLAEKLLLEIKPQASGKNLQLISHNLEIISRLKNRPTYLDQPNQD